MDWNVAVPPTDELAVEAVETMGVFGSSRQTKRPCHGDAAKSAAKQAKRQESLLGAAILQLRVRSRLRHTSLKLQQRTRMNTNKQRPCNGDKAKKEARQFFEEWSSLDQGPAVRYCTCYVCAKNSVLTGWSDQQDGLESWVGHAGTKKRCSLRSWLSSQLRSGVADENSVFLLLLFRWCYRSLIILYR
jgi:hypothetical protein